MSSKERRRKGVLASASGEKSNSLDWDSPSTKTGTVKRRPNSGDYETHICKNTDTKLEDKPKRSKDSGQKWFFSPKKFKNSKPIEEKVFNNYEELDFEAPPKDQRKTSRHNYELLMFEKPKFPETSNATVFHNYEELEFEKCDILRSKIPSRIKHARASKYHDYELLSFEKTDANETSNHNYELLDFEDDNAHCSYLKNKNCNNETDQSEGDFMERQKNKRIRPEQLGGSKERLSCRSTINWEQSGSLRGSTDDVGQAVKPSGHSNSSRRVRVLSLDASQERIKFIHDFVQSKYVVYKKERGREDKSREEGRKSVPSAIEWRSLNSSETASGVSYPPKEEGKYGKPTKCRKRLTLPGDFITAASGKNQQEWTVNNSLQENGGTGDEVEEERSLVLEYVAAKPGRVSDTDSGIASPLSPGSVYGFFGCDKNVEKRGDRERLDKCLCCADVGGVQIYTDWANHYLEKAKSKKRVHSLATDCSDGVLLAEVIESVTCQKIPDINRKPKSPSQMLDNINLCLSTLQNQHVAGVDAVSAQELRDGKLKAILALFFALSRHKQAAKARAQQQQQQEMTPNRSSAIPHKANAGGTASSIPLPGSAIPARRCPPDKVRPVAGSSRSSSPALSMIPRGPTQQVASPYQTEKAAVTSNGQIQKNSMLDKLKLFKNTEKPVQSNGKRTSSSSGVSSARSERSDSSISLEPHVDLKPIRNTSRLKQARPGKPTQQKNSPNATKKEVLTNKSNKTAVEVEKHAHKVANLPTTKLVEPKVKVTVTKEPSPVMKSHIPPPAVVGTGIPKPTAAIKGTTKISRDTSTSSFKPIPSTGISRESSQVSLKQYKPAIAMVSPIKNESNMSESTNSSSTTGPSSDSSMICKASSESSSEHQSSSPSKKLLDVSEEAQQSPQSPKETEKEEQHCDKEKDDSISKEFERRDDNLGHIKEEEREDSPGISIEPMRPLLRGYCSTLTLPSRQRHYHHKVPPDCANDYCEVSLANGYLSDGEILRNTAMMDIGDGYMSEGGSVLYTRRLQTMPAHLPNGSPHRLTGGCSGLGGTCAGNGLGVLTEQAVAAAAAAAGGRRQGGGGGSSRDSPPPPPAPRANAKPRNGAPSPSSGGSSSGHHHHEHSSSGKHSSSGHQWKRYTDSPGVGSPAVIVHHQQQPPPAPAPGSPPAGRRKGSPHSHSGGKEKGGGGGNKGARGVPQSFGYVKRNGNGGHQTVVVNGAAVANGQTIMQVVQNPTTGKTQAVSVVPRTKVKVSGGTQTCSSDLQQSHKASPPAFKSYSLTGNTANQLSQSVRERLMMGSQSLPKGAVGVVHHVDYGPVMRTARPKASDGSLSDTQAIESAGNPYAPWLRHSNTYSVAPRLSETDSMESLTSLPSHRSSLTHTRLLRDSPSRLSRSNSIRSTKSEKLYPSMLHRNNSTGGNPNSGSGCDPSDAEPYYCVPSGAAPLSHWSQPTSPAPAAAGRTFPLSPTHPGAPSSQGGRHGMPKNDDVHGSSISLVSTASSLYSSAEEKQAHEIRKLRRELQEAQEKVHTLTSQLSTNAHVVSAFEQSLTSMTQRLQHLTATSEKKDAELQELRQAMDALRAQSLQAGIGRDSGSNGSSLARQPSSDSVSSLSSACSIDKQHDKKKKKGWLRSSFTKAFSRNAKVTKVQCQQHPASEGGCTDSERGHSPPPPPAPTDAGREVAELQKQLREKDLVLTDIRLEALSSAHQLESLKDTVMKMRSEMLSLKQNNERLQRMVSGSGTGSIVNGSSTGSSSPTPNLSSDLDGRRNGSIDALCDLVPAVDEQPPEAETDGRRVAISVYLGQPQSFDKYYVEHYGYDGTGTGLGADTSATTEISIAYTTIGAVTSWPQLDNAVRRAFKQYVARLDPGGGLGLGSDAIASYKLGEAERKPDRQPPDLLPVGYAVGRVTTVHVVLQPVAALAFEALIPKGVAQRLVSLLAEHRRLVLCGAPGTGKTHLATRLAEFHAQSLGRDPAEAVATFNVDNQSAKDLRQYLSHLSEQAAAGGEAADALPCVVVLDDLHKAESLAEALGQLPRNLPCLIGTMAQSACSATSLQLQHGFRWVLVAPHMEPARGLLGRVLRRRLATLELERGPQPELAAILGWLPRVWQHLNAFLETHSSGDVAIGPRLFLSCPLELDAARAWFADVWNYSLAPYLREAAREGLRLYGRRAPWTDPARFVLETYPWPGAPPHGLATIPARDVGLPEGGTTGGTGSTSGADEGDGDPLLSMLMRLQEAANYSSPHSNDSDCNSIDSNATHNSSNVGTESVS